MLNNLQKKLFVFVILSGAKNLSRVRVVRRTSIEERFFAPLRKTPFSESDLMKLALLQPRPDRHVLEESGQHRRAVRQRRRNDHAVGFHATQLARSQVGDDHHFTSH